MQYFKATDEEERRVVSIFEPVISLLTGDKKEMFDGAYEAYPLGDALWNAEASPMVGVVTPAVFRISYFAFHELFTSPATFEFYLDVFRAVWGENVEVEFVVPSPGHLQINITALDTQPEYFNTREIVNNQYVYSRVIAQGGSYDGFYLMFQGSRGIKSQQEADALIKELHPVGVYTEINLQIGSG